MVLLGENRQDSHSSISSLSSFGGYSPTVPNRLQSISSDSSSQSNRYVENVLRDAAFPAEPHYIPIVIPRQPALQELLRQVSGQNDIENVETLEIRVASRVVSIQRIALFMPNLTHLNLEGSALTSLREFGSLFNNLRYLNISNCGLRSLDGTLDLRTLQILIADNNFVETIYPCLCLENLHTLSLKGNLILDINSISFLAMCTSLKTLSLRNNPIASNQYYRQYIQNSLPSLEIFDGEAIVSNGDENVQENSRDFDRPVGLSKSKRMESVQISIENRPSCSFDHLRDFQSDQFNMENSTPICGNIINKVRAKHSTQNSKTITQNCTDDSLASNSTSCSSTNLENDLDFPKELPQTLVELELGVVGVRSQTEEDQIKRTQENWKIVAKRWREEYYKLRNNFDSTE